MTAVFHDTYEALKVAVSCFSHGVAACICTSALTLEPRWLRPEDRRYTDEQKCYKGDALKQIETQIYGIVDRAWNNMGNVVGGMFTKLFSGGHAVPALSAFEEADARIRSYCENGLDPHKHGSADDCYYVRTRQICHSDDLYDVFAKMENGAFDTQSQIPVRERDLSSGMLKNINLFKEPTALCYAHEEISLNMLIEACTIAMIAGNQKTGQGGIFGCNSKQSDDFKFVLGNSTWYLLDVRFSYTANPPPPPPQDAVLDALITEFDGEFYSWFREEIKTWYPPVQALFQNNETELAKYGGRKLYNMQKTRITLAIEGLDPDSLAARMIASIFSSTWAHGCRMLHAAMNDTTLARAGAPWTEGDPFPPPPPPEGVNGGYDGGYRPPYDRNLLVYWAAAFYRTSTNAPTIDFDPLLIHSQFCEEPCRWQEVMPPFDPATNEKYFYPEPLALPDCSEWAPILGYGSLRQLRSSNPFDSSKFGEDVTLRPNVFPRDTRPFREANNGIPYQYRDKVLCTATEESCDSIFQDAPKFAPVFPYVDRSNENHKDLINDNQPITDSEEKRVADEYEDVLRAPSPPPWRSNEYKRNPFYNMVCIESRTAYPCSISQS